MGTRIWTDQTYSRFRDAREPVEDEERGGHPKSTRTEVNIAVIADLVKKKWPSNRINNDSRIFEHPQDPSSSDSDRGFGKESCVHVLFHTPWHLSKGKIESHLAKTLSRWPMQTNFFKQTYYGRCDLVFCLWPRNKATVFWMGWWDIHSAEETEILNVPHQDHVNNFFDSQGLVHKEFVPKGKRGSAEFWKE